MNTSFHEYPWYGVVSGGDIQQGDILNGCPVFASVADAGDGQLDLDRSFEDVIVMSQSCDLKQGKSPSVLLCKLIQRSEIPLDHPLTRVDNLERVRKGNMPAFHLLAGSDLENPFRRELTLVDFRQTYTLPFKFVQSVARLNHLRLLPPYREHLSQAFARFFMRVGLPIDIPQLK